MYSNKSEYDRRWQYGDRNPRDDGNTRWKERPGAHSDTQRGSYHKFAGQAHTSAERTSGSKEYSDSPQRPYYKEQANRERSRKSPARRRPSSEEWSISEKRRRRYTEDEEADFRYRYESEDKIYKYSPEDTARTHVNKDFKRVTPPEEDFKYRMTSQEPRPRQQHEDFTYRHEVEDFNYRRPSYKDRDGQERSRDHSAERTRPQEFPTKVSDSSPRLIFPACLNWISIKCLSCNQRTVPLRRSSVLLSLRTLKCHCRVLPKPERNITALQIERIISQGQGSP